MKLISIIAIVPYVVGVLCCEVSADGLNPARGIQIVAPVNHAFHLELNELEAILARDDIKDHNIAVISIAGAFRQGKSFLLNFFIKFLNAQVNGAPFSFVHFWDVVCLKFVLRKQGTLLISRRLLFPYSPVVETGDKYS